MASEEAVLPWLITRIPWSFAKPNTAPASELDCGPITICAPRPYNTLIFSAATEAVSRESSMSPTTRYRRCSPSISRLMSRTASCSAAALAAPREAPSPVSEKSAPMRMVVEAGPTARCFAA